MTDLLEKLRAIVGESGYIDSQDLQGRGAGIWDQRPLQALALIRPKNTEEVASVLKTCNQAGQSVIAVGGMTGLAGAHHSTSQDILLSLERMNKIEEIDSHARTMTVEAGAILQNVQEAAADKNLMFALDLGARASCTIGGNIATNAGGIRVLRYGMMRELVLGLEVVLADGSVVSSMFKVLKNNTGYDLRQLFTGSEGTLAVITRAVLRLHEIPKSIDSALLAVPNWAQVMQLMRDYDAALSGRLAAYEVLWQNFYELNTGTFSNLTPPLETAEPYYVLIDVFNCDRDTLEELLTTQLGNNQITDGILASSEGERQQLWQIRENFEPEQNRFDVIYGYDISLPIEAMEDYVDEVTLTLKHRFNDSELFSYGHIADGNLHFSIAPGMKASFTEVNDIVYSPLQNLGGSISAEHGIGLEKKPYLKLTRSETEINLMRRIKQTLDPQGILNPGKLFD